MVKKDCVSRIKSCQQAFCSVLVLYSLSLDFKKSLNPQVIFIVFKCFQLTCIYNLLLKTTLSLIHHFETVPNSKKLQTTTEMWLLKDFKIQIALKTLWEKVKLLILSNFTFFHDVFLKFFPSMC